MKLFNWMQRRFHHTSFKDENKAEFITNHECGKGKQTLLKQVALVDVFDGWKDGILTIGTLGLDPLKPFNQHNEYLVLEEEDIDFSDQEEEENHSDIDDDEDDVDHSNVNEEEEEENPLIFTRFEHKIEDDFDEKMETNSSGDECEDDVPSKGKGERTTLAELFMADSEMKKEEKQLGFVEIIHEKKLAKKPSKNGLSFAKKFMPNVGEDKRPIKKIHQLMKRMLKRKIHPEVEGKGITTDDSSKENGISESVSLLPTRPALGPTI